MPTQSDVAEHLGISQPLVSQLLRSGVIPAPAGRGGLDPKTCRLAYIAHLREVAAGRASATADDETLDIVAERARLARAQSERIEMQNDVTRGQVVLVEDVTREIASYTLSIRNKLLSLPNSLAARLHARRSVLQVHDLLRDEITHILKDLSETEQAAEPDGPEP